jgi:hypothetical protein
MRLVRLRLCIYDINLYKVPKKSEYYSYLYINILIIYIYVSLEHSTCTYTSLEAEAEDCKALGNGSIVNWKKPRSLNHHVEESHPLTAD